jgi:hypothetical protein
MPNTVKWLTFAVSVLVSAFTVVSRVTHFAPSQKAMTRSFSAAPAGKAESSNVRDRVMGGSNVAPLGPMSRAMTMAFCGGAGGVIAGAVSVRELRGEPLAVFILVPAGTSREGFPGPELLNLTVYCTLPAVSTVRVVLPVKPVRLTVDVAAPPPPPPAPPPAGGVTPVAGVVADASTARLLPTALKATIRYW